MIGEAWQPILGGQTVALTQLQKLRHLGTHRSQPLFDLGYQALLDGSSTCRGIATTSC